MTKECALSPKNASRMRVPSSMIETSQQQNCDCVFMASHGRKGLAAVLLGSETQKVLTHSKIPVMVYR